MAVTLRHVAHSSSINNPSTKPGRILAKRGGTTLRGKAFAELFSVERRTQWMSLQCEVLPNRSEARHERLRVFGVTKTTYASRSRIG